MVSNRMGSIFEEHGRPLEGPLAARLRPKALAEVVGHSKYLGPGGLISTAVESRRLVSMLLYGPPGSGKTTIANLIAKESGYRFVPLLATSLGVKEIKDVVSESIRAFEITDSRTVVFIDEIHRLTKVQSDALLAPVEEGVFVLLGATTENPWMQVSPALLSRVHVIGLAPLEFSEVSEVLRHAELEIRAQVGEGVIQLIYDISAGDLRSALNILEGASRIALTRQSDGSSPPIISEKDVLSIREKVSRGLSASDHYEMTSALIKSMRASNANAALYWLARLLVNGEDPRFIARRLVIFASEDVGLADPTALILAEAAINAAERIGMPEVRINLGHCVSYLSLAPKSKAAYQAINWAMQVAEKTTHLKVPHQLRGSVSGIEVARGKTEEEVSTGNFFPGGLASIDFLKNWTSDGA